MASKEGAINLVVTCEQERVLKWVMQEIDACDDVCLSGDCGHHHVDRCIADLLDRYREESDPTDDTPDSAEQEANRFSVRLLTPCGHELSESECVGTPNWQNKWRCKVCGLTYSR